jgi:hypothetical protein
LRSSWATYWDPVPKDKKKPLGILSAAVRAIVQGLHMWESGCIAIRHSLTFLRKMRSENQYVGHFSLLTLHLSLGSSQAGDQALLCNNQCYRNDGSRRESQRLLPGPPPPPGITQKAEN